METTHKFIVGDSRKKILKSNSINLVVTSPPYPMIKMWDKIFKSMNKKIDFKNSEKTFALMNLEIKKVYQKAYYALKNGGFLIINIGDATRSLEGKFNLFPNGARTIEMCRKIGFTMLPQIHWWKPTNSPNKFLGSGMYPAGAYVTLENEHILIFRKGEKRVFDSKEMILRKKSSFFQSERNVWFSDIWKDVVGAKQSIKGLSRKRNGAFPIELVYRLINMYSIENDIIWDPFGGTGTTTIAAIMAKRSSIICDIDKTFIEYSIKRAKSINIFEINKKISNRAKLAIKNIENKLKKKVMKFKYKNPYYGSVFAKQETKIQLPILKSIKKEDKKIIVKYK